MAGEDDPNVSAESSRSSSPEKPGDGLMRMIVSPIMLGLIAGVVYLQEATGSPIGTHLVLALFGALAGAEMALLFRASRGVGEPLFAAIGCALLCGVGLFDHAGVGGVMLLGGTMSARVTILFLLILYLLLRHLRDTRPEAVDGITLQLVPLIYIGFLFSFMAEFVFDWRVLVVIVLSSKASDMAGWAIGVPFGKHKMIPSVSPGKSWEGTIGGLVASTLVAMFLPLAFGLYSADYPWIPLAFLGLLLGAASILAGVTWSGWKRRLGTKHSGVIPGLGGIVDMVDSLLLAGPAAFLWFHLVF